MEIFGKTAVFPGGYGRIGEILHGRIWPDWGNTARADMAGLGKYCMGGYGRIGVYRVKHNITVSVEGSLSIN